MEINRGIGISQTMLEGALFYHSRYVHGCFTLHSLMCRLDLHMPKNIDGPKPVVAFVTGGAWIIGLVKMTILPVKLCLFTCCLLRDGFE